jgi:hypothetical protein
MGALSNVSIEMDSRRAASDTLTHAENERGTKLDLVLLHGGGFFATTTGEFQLTVRATSVPAVMQTRSGSRETAPGWLRQRLTITTY